MKIARVEVHPYEFHRDHGHTNALGSSSAEFTALFIRLITDEGVVGTGYAHPNVYITGETLESMKSIMQILIPQLIGADPMDNELLTAKLFRGITFNYRIRAAVDVALYDLKARILGVPLCQLLGGKGRTRFTGVRMVAIETPQGMAQKAERFMQAGYAGVKIKVGLDPDTDPQRIRDVRSAIGKGATFIVDPNQGYTLKTALRVFSQVEDCGIFLIEQPLRIGDLAGFRELRRALRIPIEVDEGIKDVADAWQVVHAEAADFVSIKIMKVGGITAARRIQDLCQMANVGCLIGATPGSKIVDAVNCHFISAHPWITLPSELGECQALQNDPATGLTIEYGVLHLPDGPGHGVDVALPAR